MFSVLQEWFDATRMYMLSICYIKTACAIRPCLGENHEEDYRCLLHYILRKCRFIMSCSVVFIYWLCAHEQILFLSLPFASVTETTCIKVKQAITNVTMDHKTSHGVHFFTKLSIYVLFVRIGQCMAEIQLLKIWNLRVQNKLYWEHRL